MFSKTKIEYNPTNPTISVRFDDNMLVNKISLPPGFSEMTEKDIESKRKLFFYSYACQRKFINEIKESAHSDTIESEDTLSENEFEYSFKDVSTDEVLTFQKLIMFDSIFDKYDELKISSIQSRSRKSTEIDYSQIHKYLNNAIYLPNDTIYIDEIDRRANIIEKSSTDIVEIFSFIYCELKRQLFEEENSKINTNTINLANNFRYQWLNADSTLFGEESHSETLFMLREALNSIDDHTVYKDYDYYHFYDAVYHFLYSNNSGVWEVNNFSFIWERICLSFAKQKYIGQLKVVEEYNKLISYDKDYDFLENFKVKFSPSKNSRYLRPDLILKWCNSIRINKDYLRNILTLFKREDSIRIALPMIDMALRKPIQIAWGKYFRKNYYNTQIDGVPKNLNVTHDEFDNFIEYSCDYLERNFDKKYFYRAKANNSELFRSTKNSNNGYQIVDYKYIDFLKFSKDLSNSIQQASFKQHVYEYAIEANILNSITQSEFWVPFFSKDSIPLRKYAIETFDFFDEYRISVIKLNFFELQKIYIANGL